MPLFLADANLLAASIQLSEGRIARARTCLDNAAALIGKHGYGRGALHLAVLNAEIANAGKAADREGMIAAAIKAVRGEPYYDERTRVSIDGGWWGLLPRLEALLPDDDFELAKLRLARDNYNDERGEYIARRKARLAGETASIPGELAESTLADRDAQATVEQVLKQRGIGGLDRMKPEEQRGAIHEAVYAVLAGTLAPNPSEVPDVTVEKVFADPEAQWPVRDMMRQYSLDGEAAGLPLETKRFIVGKLKEHGLAGIEVPALAEPPSLPPHAKKSGWWPFAGD